MAADFNKPVTTDGYASVLSALRENDQALAVALDPALVTPANVPTGAVRWTSASSKWQRYNGTAWADITPANNITGNAATATTAAACSGNAATATALATARTIDGVSFNGGANIEVLAPATAAAPSKGTPVDADQLPLVDSAAANGLKKLTWTNLKATLKTYCDTLYAKVGAITTGGITMSTARLLGRSTALTGAVEEITLGTGLSFSGTTLNLPAAASEGEMTAGTEAGLRSMSPLLIAQAIAALGDNSITLGTPVTLTTGTSIEFSSIPSWVKHIVIMGVGVSTGNTSPLMCRIGDSGGVETSGYSSSSGKIAGAANYQTGTAGFLMSGDAVDSAGDAVTFKITLDLEDATENTWVFTSHMIMAGAAKIHIGCGQKSLSAVLDRVSITTVGGTANFDAGEINISYE